MKKIFTLVVALFSLAMGANAETSTVGATDNTSAFWTEFSDYYSLTGDGTITLKFTNYSAKTANFHNWVCYLTTDADRGADGYSEYFAMRPDNWAWGSGWDTGGTGTCPGTLSSGINWTNFQSDMDGSDVVITVTRKGDTIKAHADMVTSDGTITDYVQFEETVASLPETIRCYMTVEKAHLTDLTGKVEAGTEYVGNIYNTNAYATMCSDQSSLTGNGKVTYTFTNYTNKVSNWNNWLCFVTTDEAIGTENSIYFVTRADNFVLNGTHEYNADNMKCTSVTDWDTFKSDMDGANVVLVVTRDGDNITVRADVTATNNTTYYEEYTATISGLPETIRTYLSAEKAHLADMTVTVSDATAINTVKAASVEDDGVIYNLAGQRVSKDTKGLVIKNGKKIVVK